MTSATKLSLVCVVLQLLQEASRYGALQPDAIDPVLAAPLKRDAVNTNLQMTANTHDILAMLKQSSRERWPASLPPATVTLLGEALLQEPGQPNVTHLLKARSTAKQVLCMVATHA